MAANTLDDFRVVELDDASISAAIWRISRRNQQYFAEHAAELWRRYDGKDLLIYGGGIVEAFDDVERLVARLDELDAETRASALHRWQHPKGNLIL